MEQIKLLEKERIVSIFCSQNGFIKEYNPDHSNMIITNIRILLHTQKQGLSSIEAAPLDQISGVSTHASERNTKHLYQGVSLILLGVFVFLLLGSVTSGGVPALLLGSAICLLGTLFIWQYLSWIPVGEIQFLVNGHSLLFPYTSNQAREQSITLLNNLSKTFSNYRSSLVDIDESIRTKTNSSN